MKRETFRLTPAERLAFAKLRNAYLVTGAAIFRFWWAAGRARGLDPATIIGVPGDVHAFTALPWGHGRHWCWPAPLKCRRTAAELEDMNEDRHRAAAELREDRYGIRSA